MAVAAVDLINMALAKVGSRPISTIDDTTPSGLIAGDVYTQERDNELRSHTWNCAVTRVRLGRLTVTPRYEYSYAYGLPSDWLRTIAVYNNDAGCGQDDYRQETILTGEVLTNGGFNTDTTWTKGTGWTISGGKAVAAAGAGSDLSQSATFTASGIYRVAFLIEQMTAGTIIPKFTGGTTVTGSTRSDNGYYVEELTAHSGGGNNTFVLSKSSTFNGTIDDVSCVLLSGGATPAIISSSEEIWVRYVRQITNPDHMDPLLRQVIVLRMAKLMAMGLANSSTYYQLLDEEMSRTMMRARSTDAIEDMPERWPTPSWVAARWAGSWFPTTYR